MKTREERIVFIERENLSALLDWEKKGLPKVNIVYLDPPYNTKSSKLTYSDTQSGNNWARFFTDRLKAIKPILQPNSVIYVSIGHHELANAKFAMDDVFGQSSLVSIMPRITHKGCKSSSTIYNAHDFLLVYKLGRVDFVGKNLNPDTYKLKDAHYLDRGKYMLRRLDRNDFKYSSTLDYPLLMNGNVHYAGSESLFYERKKSVTLKDWCWLWTRERVKFALRNDFLVVKNGHVWAKSYTNCSIQKKNGAFFLSYDAKSQKYDSLELANDRYLAKDMHTSYERMFSYPKSFAFMQAILSWPKINDKIVLDPFAGCGITARVASDLGLRAILVQKKERTKANSAERKRHGIKNIAGITRMNIPAEASARAGGR